MNELLQRQINAILLYYPNLSRSRATEDARLISRKGWKFSEYRRKRDSGSLSINPKGKQRLKHAKHKRGRKYPLNRADMIDDFLKDVPNSTRECAERFADNAIASRMLNTDKARKQRELDKASANIQSLCEIADIEEAKLESELDETLWRNS